MQGQSSSSPLAGRPSTAEEPALRNPNPTLTPLPHSTPLPLPHPGSSRSELDDARRLQYLDVNPDVDEDVNRPTSLLSQVTASLPFASASSRVAGGSGSGSAAGAVDVMEMKPIVEHRRRKSSLMNPVALGVGPGRPNGLDREAASSPGPASAAKDESMIAAAGAGMDSPSDDFDYNEYNDDYNDDDNGDDGDDDENNHLRDDEETGLSNKERARRQKQRLRNTQLGQRIARDRDRSRDRDTSRSRNKGKSRSRTKSLSAEERQEANKDVLKRLLVNGVLILAWYFFSLSISLYNKWMFDRERLNFAFPLFTTSMHMLVQFCLSALVLYLVPSLRPAQNQGRSQGRSQGHTSDLGRSRHETEARGSMTKLFYITRVGPCGAATGLDIGLGNTSLKFISLTFYTMCKSSSLAFVLLFAFVFRLEKPTCRLIGIIATMTMGVVLMVSGEVEFRLSGFLLVISAAAFSGFRWSLTQILLLRNPTTSNPFSSIFFLTPVMFLTIILIAVPVEGLANFWAGMGVLSDQYGVVLAPLFLLFPGCIAFLMTASEFALLKRTSVVTLSIAGIFKEVVTISAASLVFKDRLTLVNAVGLVTTMVAIIAYNYIKITKMRDDARVEVHGRVADSDSNSNSPRSNNSGSEAENDEGVEETAGLLGESADWVETQVVGRSSSHHKSKPVPR